MDTELIEIRSYRSLFRFNRRLFRFGEYRLPVPGGIPTRSIGYAAAALVAVAVLSRLPAIGVLVTAIPWQVRWLAAPVFIAWALSTQEFQGRPPHVAGWRMLAWSCGPRWVRRFKRITNPMAATSILDDLTITPDLNTSEARPGRIHGPATVITRYTVQMRDRTRDREVDIFPTGSDVPLSENNTITVPEGATLIIHPN